MYKTELIKKVAKETRLSQKVVAAVFNRSLAQIQAALGSGEKVILPGFGSFYTRLHPAGKVRHIRTGQMVKLPESTRVGFRVGELLKKAAGKPRRRRRSFWPPGGGAA